MVFEGWKIKFGTVVRHDKIKKLIGIFLVFFFVNEGGLKFPKNSEKTEKSILTTEKKEKVPVVRFFILS